MSEGEQGRRKVLRAVAVFAVWLALLLLFFTRQPLLYDNDSYYHLAIARLYAQEGPVERLEAVRFSVMGEGFGDKELLFHLLLVPFASLMDPVRGGQLFLALILAALFVVLGQLARPVLGGWGWLLPLLLVLTSTEVAWRMVRLRPELLSLLLLLLTLAAIGRAGYRWLLPLSFLYAWSYTAFHAYLGLCGLVFLWRGWARRSWEWGMVLYPAIGVGLGLVLHLHFPDNLAVWVLQSFDFFQEKGRLDVGTEIRPNFTSVTLMVNLGWWLLLGVLWRSREPERSREGSSHQPQRQADAWGVATVVFGVLYLLMSRFSLYFFPLAAMWLLSILRSRGETVGRRVALPGRGAVPFWLAVAACLLVGAPEATRQLANYRERNAAGPEQARIRDREGLAAALPEGARVAARWQQTPIYMLWAPQARYLNVLDPVFMARPYPAEFEAQRRLFAGDEPDVALRLAVDLDSELVAFSLTAPTGDLRHRLDGDPRFVPRHRDINVLYQVLPDRNRDFVLDWRIVPAEVPLPVRGDSETAAWPSYPRHPSPLGRAVEGYVDVRRVTDRDCLALVSEPPRSLPAVSSAGGPDRTDTIALELASWGPARLWVGERLALEERSGNRAVLGRGVRVPLTLDEAEQSLTVLACGAAGEPAGFALRALSDLTGQAP